MLITQLIAEYNSVDKSSIVLFLVLAIFAWIMWKAQGRKDAFDMKEMLIDPVTNYVSLIRFSQLIALIMSSWGFVYLVLHGLLTEMYFTIYMSIYSVTSVLGKGIDAIKSTATAPLGNLTTTSTDTSTTTTTTKQE